MNELFGGSKKQAEYECYTSGICENLSDDQRDLVIYEQIANNAQQTVEPFEQANEALIALGIDFTPIIGDAKAFAEAEDSIDYAIASVGIIPGVGDAVGKVLKEAKAALKLGDGKTATELYQKAQQMVSDFIHNKKGSVPIGKAPVKPLDVGSYRELKANEKVGDMLEHDHIPSFAALKKAEETRLGRPLTPTESKKLYNEATTVEVPKDVHQKGSTYGGKNTPEQIQKDATDLCGAVCRDTDALRKNMIEKGYDPKRVEDAINKIIARNKEMGIY